MRTKRSCRYFQGKEISVFEIENDETLEPASPRVMRCNDKYRVGQAWASRFDSIDINEINNDSDYVEPWASIPENSVQFDERLF